MARNKKNFSLNGVSFSLVTGCRNYVEYYREVVPNSGVFQRVRVFKGLNTGSLAQREMARIAIAENATKKSGIIAQTLERHKADFRLKTWQTYTCRIKYFYEWLGKKSEAITVRDAVDFLQYLATAKGLKPATVKGYHRTLSGLYIRAGLPNVWEKLKTPPAQSQSLLYFTPQQITVLKLAMGEASGLWLATRFLFYCFIRPGELRGLRFEHLDLHNGIVRIPANIAKNKRPGTVVIPTNFLAELRADNTLEGFSGADYVIGYKGLPGARILGKDYLNRKHATIMEACSIYGRYAFYSWKHTGAVMAVRAGINLKDLQLQLRHHSLDMVNEYLKNLGVLDSKDLRAKFPGI